MPIRHGSETSQTLTGHAGLLHLHRQGWGERRLAVVVACGALAWADGARRYGRSPGCRARLPLRM